MTLDALTAPRSESGFLEFAQLSVGGVVLLIVLGNMATQLSPAFGSCFYYFIIKSY